MPYRFTSHLPEPDQTQLVVVDIGYSATGKTCGLGSQTGLAKKFAFGECILASRDLLIDLTNPTLILEAVLITYHCSQSGNPGIRGEFERGRGWYCQPGVVTYAAALRFIDQLNTLLPPGPPVAIAEAFLSNKRRKTTDPEDARQICDEFWRTRQVAVTEGCYPISDLIDGVPTIRVFETG